MCWSLVKSVKLLVGTQSYTSTALKFSCQCSGRNRIPLLIHSIYQIQNPVHHRCGWSHERDASWGQGPIWSSRDPSEASVSHRCISVRGGGQVSALRGNLKHGSEPQWQRCHWDTGTMLLCAMSAKRSWVMLTLNNYASGSWVLMRGVAICLALLYKSKAVDVGLFGLKVW